MKIILIIATLFLLMSCEKVVNIDLDTAPERLVVDRDDRDQRTDVQENGQLKRTFSGKTHEVLEHGEVAGAGDRQEFGGTLYDAEDDRFEIFHHS